MKASAFLWGMGTGLVAGAAAAMMAPSGQSMKTQVGQAVQKAGDAVEHAVDSAIDAIEK